MKIPSIQTDTTAQGLMTTKELAVYLRVTTRTIANLLKRRKIPVIRVGSINRYQVDKVVEALTEGQ
jgi:excisionase family DNA binding protein